jgi:hypothetical protein
MVSNPFEILIEEHDLIERELIELENVINSYPINVPNLIRILKRLKEIWIPHELKEENIFCILNENNIKVSMEKIELEHSEFKKYREEIYSAIDLGKEDILIDVLNKKGKEMIFKIRKHMSDEDWIIRALSWDELDAEIKADFELL